MVARELSRPPLAPPTLPLTLAAHLLAVTAPAAAAVPEAPLPPALTRPLPPPPLLRPLPLPVKFAAISIPEGAVSMRGASTSMCANTAKRRVTTLDLTALKVDYRLPLQLWCWMSLLPLACMSILPHSLFCPALRRLKF